MKTKEEKIEEIIDKSKFITVNDFEGKKTLHDYLFKIGVRLKKVYYAYVEVEDYKNKYQKIPKELGVNCG